MGAAQINICLQEEEKSNPGAARGRPGTGAQAGVGALNTPPPQVWGRGRPVVVRGILLAQSESGSIKILQIWCCCSLRRCLVVSGITESKLGLTWA